MLELEERIETPEEELKRADHLVYVSLKYTRTCDIMKNAVKRLIAAYERTFDEYLEDLKKKRKIPAVPGTSKEKATLIKEQLGSPVRKYLTLYNTLKKIGAAECKGVEEFRKNVTLITQTPRPISIKMDDLNKFLHTTKEFVAFLRQKME